MPYDLNLGPNVNDYGQQLRGNAFKDIDLPLASTNVPEGYGGMTALGKGMKQISDGLDDGPENSIIREVSSGDGKGPPHRIIAMDDPHGDAQKRLALDDGEVDHWEDQGRVDAAKAMRLSYLMKRGLQGRAAPWDNTSPDTRKMWIEMVDVVIEAYQRARSSAQTPDL